MANSDLTVHLSALTYEVASGISAGAAHLLPAADFAPDDGRELPFEKFKMSAEVAGNLIAKMSARKNDTVIDYEHQTLYTALNGQPAPAAGWFKQMEYRADGLWAVGIKWVATAASKINSKEYRYISAVFTHDTKGNIFDVVSVALTNTPALDGLAALAAFSKTFNQDPKLGELPMSGNDTAALTAERDTLKTNVAALTAERDTLKTSVTALTADLKTANDKLAAVEEKAAADKLAAEAKAHTDLVAAALSDGRLAPAQKAWAEKQSLTALSEYLDVSKPLVDSKKQFDGKDAAGEHGLNETELAMCSRMGVTPEAFAKTKANEAALKAQIKGE